MLQITAIGNLGRDCQVQNVNGRSVINFAVAHTEKFQDRSTGEMREKTTWLDCAYWTDKTGIAQYLHKGQQVCIQGQPDIRTYQTKDGRQGAIISVRVQRVELLGGRPQGANNGQTAPSATQPAPSQPVQQQPTTAAPADTVHQPANYDLPF